MSITLFADTNFGGASLTVSGDLDTLRGTRVGNNPRSIRMKDDAILLCKKSNWNGEVFYLRGTTEISDLGDPDQGGKKGFGSSVTSVRITSFTVKVNVTVVTGDDGTLPDIWTSRNKVVEDINSIITMANDFYKGQKALLRVSLSDLTFRADEKRFRMSNKEWGSIPGSWKKAHEVDIVFPDTVEEAVGIGKFPWHGKFCLVSARRDNVAEIARTFVHELGHFWSLTHESGNGQPSNIMTQSDTGNPITASKLLVSQIEDIQQVLARNLSRQGDRIE